MKPLNECAFTIINPDECALTIINPDGSYYQAEIVEGEIFHSYYYRVAEKENFYFRQAIKNADKESPTSVSGDYAKMGGCMIRNCIIGEDWEKPLLEFIFPNIMTKKQIKVFKDITLPIINVVDKSTAFCNRRSAKKKHKEENYLKDIRINKYTFKAIIEFFERLAMKEILVDNDYCIIAPDGEVIYKIDRSNRSETSMPFLTVFLDYANHFGQLGTGIYESTFLENGYMICGSRTCHLPENPTREQITLEYYFEQFLKEGIEEFQTPPEIEDLVIRRLQN